MHGIFMIHFCLVASGLDKSLKLTGSRLGTPIEIDVRCLFCRAHTSISMGTPKEIICLIAPGSSQ